MDYYLDYIEKLRNRKPEADEPLYYLKDWHLALESDEEPFYDWPDHFRSDWLNEYTINTGKQDYRFVYFGPAESKTGFHQDVLKSSHIHGAATYVARNYGTFGNQELIRLNWKEKDILKTKLFLKNVKN
jgi:hypothetical protein